MRFSFSYLRSTSVIFGLILIAFAINPITELLEFSQESLFMASHYALFIGGFLLTRRLKLPPLLVVLSILGVVFWHLPLFYGLAAGEPAFRTINDVTMLVAGMLAGGASNSLSFSVKILLFIAWMGADSVLSVILIVGWPYYSNSIYSFSPYPISQELITGLVMFGIMTVVFVYVIFTMLRSVFKI